MQNGTIQYPVLIKRSNVKIGFLISMRILLLLLPVSAMCLILYRVLTGKEHIMPIGLFLLPVVAIGWGLMYSIRNLVITMYDKRPAVIIEAEGIFIPNHSNEYTFKLLWKAVIDIELLEQRHRKGVLIRINNYGNQYDYAAPKASLMEIGEAGRNQLYLNSSTYEGDNYNLFITLKACRAQYKQRQMQNHNFNGLANNL